MFYRRKLLLALIELCGGKIKRTDCLKLLFLFCQYTTRNYYDFFPHKYGSFSLLVYQDKKRLTTLGFLRNANNFELTSPDRSFVHEIKKQDQQSLTSIVSNLGHVRGKELIKKTYLEFPEYTCRSEILETILNQQEIIHIKTSWNMDNTPCLFTIGYQGATIDAYLNRLIQNNVKVLIDVRKNPLSMKYGFSKNRLQTSLVNAGLHYVHLPDLGIPSQQRQHLDDAESYKRLFEHYEKEILPKQTEAIETIQHLLKQYHRLALTCFEADHHFCHRHKITEYMKNVSGVTPSIIHL